MKNTLERVRVSWDGTVERVGVLVALCAATTAGCATSSSSGGQTAGSAGQGIGAAGSTATGTGGSSGTGGAHSGTGGNANSTGGNANSGGAGGALSCGTNDWPTYGHDPQRTFSSDGCMTGPLKFLWSYFPQGMFSSNIASVDNAITHTGTVYVRFSSSYGPQMDGVGSSNGKRVWTWAGPGGRDVLTKHWATYAQGTIMVADDGLFLVDAASGANKNSINAYDDWGQNTADAQRFYINSDINSPDGPGIYIGAYSFTGAATWKQDLHKACDRVWEKRGSVVVDGTMLFRAGQYSAGAPAPSGVAAYAATNGAPGWKQSTTPVSALSAGGGRLYLVEGTGSAALVARSQTNGSVAWSAPLSATTVSTQAPVVAGDLVIIATASDVRAFNAKDGTPAWTAANITASVGPAVDGSGAFNNCPGNAVAWSTIPYTTLAAASGSRSLVVGAKDAIHILSLSDGKELWKGTPSGMKGPLRDPVIVGHTLYGIDTGASAAGRLVALSSP